MGIHESLKQAKTSRAEGWAAGDVHSFAVEPLDIGLLFGGGFLASVVALAHAAEPIGVVEEAIDLFSPLLGVLAGGLDLLDVGGLDIFLEDLAPDLPLAEVVRAEFLAFVLAVAGDDAAAHCAGWLGDVRRSPARGCHNS